MNLSNENIVHVCCPEGDYLQFKRLLEYPNLYHSFAIKSFNFRGSNDTKTISEDYMKFMKWQGLKYEKLVRPLQKHTDNILKIESKINDDKPDIFLDYLNDVDGVITDKKDFVLATTSADCISLIMFDPVKNVVANVHSGWRGTFKKISKKAVEVFISEYGSNAKDIIVGICPSIRMCHFEVKNDVESECRKLFEYTGKINDIIKFKGMESGEEKFFIDTILITKLLLIEAGVLKENIIDSGICSLCEKESMNTRRGDGEEFGLNAAFVCLK